jgi:hypothetical protein
MTQIGVVFVSYLKVPEQRLRDHFRWNASLYESYGDRLRVYVVSDVEHDLPSYAETIVYPIEKLPVVDGQPRFSLTMTKNAGNDAALADGAEVIICTDVDICFWTDSFDTMTRVDEMCAAIPVYRMAPSYEQRDEGRFDHGCTGTIAMTAANWRRLRFDERYVAYGGDDGQMLQDICTAGLTVLRSTIVSHIAHRPGDVERIPGSGAASCWGREDGFNFDNFHNNRRLRRR